MWQRKEIQVGSWKVLLVNDDDNHLNVFISNEDGSDVIPLNADFDFSGEWGERFTTSTIEDLHISNEAKGV